MMPHPILEAKALSKHFEDAGKRISLFDGVSFSLQAGESLSIQGASGSGKTSLLNLIACLDSPSSGELRYDGKALHALDSRERKGLQSRFMALVLQNYILIPELSALENVLMPWRIEAQTMSPSDAYQRAQTLMAEVGLSKRMQALPETLSGGERQRVAIARALMNQPKLLLADEPTGNLDYTSAKRVIDLLLSSCTQHRMALILVTHNRAFASLTQHRFSLQDGLLLPQK